jgi:hypothetical protein
MVRLINTGLLEVPSSFKICTRLHLIWCNKFMSSHLSCNRLQSTFSRSLIKCRPTYNCSSLPVTTCTIPLIINSLVKDVPLTVYYYSADVDGREETEHLMAYYCHHDSSLIGCFFELLHIFTASFSVLTF